MTDVNRKRPLPYGRQTIVDSDLEAVREALQSDLLTTGPRVGAFETAVSAAAGGGLATAVSSGTAALHLANLALGVGPDDAIVAPAITFAATANAVRMCGAEVVFADVDPDTGLITPEALDAAIARAREAFGRTPTGAWVTHYAGQPPRMDDVAAVAARHGLWLGEDACHALGTTYRFGEAAGTIGDCRWSRAATFSFHPVKTVTTGEGGAILTGDPALDARCKLLRSHGISRDAGEIGANPLAMEAASGEINPWFYDMLELGFNYRVPDVLCALGLSQIERLGVFLKQRSALVAEYDRLLAARSNAILPLSRTPGAAPGWHLYVVLIDFAQFGLTRAECMHRLRGHGISTQVHYIPVPLLSYYRKCYGDPLTAPQTFPGAMAFYRRCLSLPLFPDMEVAEVSRVVEALDAVLYSQDAVA